MPLAFLFRNEDLLYSHTVIINKNLFKELITPKMETLKSKLNHNTAFYYYYFSICVCCEWMH